MATSDKDITIKVTVDSKGAVTAFQQLENAAQTTGRNLQQSQTSAVNAIQGSYTELLSKINLVKEAYGVLSGAVGIAFDAIQRGSKVNDVSEAFTKLSEKAGATADVFLNQLNQATGETISNFDLMRKANESLRAGIKPDEFIVLTQAARALSEETGQNLTESMEEVTRAFESGRVQMLKNRLGVIDVEAAENKLAAQLGVGREQLTKNGQVLAARTALLDAAKAKSKEFGQITNDAGDNLDKFNKFLTDARDRFFEAISKNDALNTLLSTLAERIKAVDFEPIITGLVKIIEIGAEVIATLAEIATQIAKTFQSQSSKIEQSIEPVLEFKEALVKLQNEGAKISGREGLERIGKKVIELEKEFRGLYKQLDEGTKGAFLDFQKGLNTLNLQFPKATKATKDQTGAVDDLAGGTNKLSDAQKKLNALIESVQRPGGIGSFITAIDQVINIYRKGYAPISEVNKAIEAQREQWIKGKGNVEDYDKAVNQLINGTLDDLSKQQESTTNAINKPLDQSGGKKGNEYSGIADLFFDFKDEETQSFANNIAGMFANAFAEVGQKMLAGEVIHREDWANITGGITSGIADALVPGTGPLAQLATDVVFSLFDSENAGTTARKEADKFFADIFDANRLLIVVDRELQRIKDLVFDGGSFADGGAFNLFQSLPDDARQAFQGVGYAFEELLGTSEDIGGQLAAVFANNVGGSLNNLQLLVATTGKSFEDLSKLVVDSFLKGQISFAEAQQALTGIQKLTEKGIPDGLGLTAEAFDNLKAAGTKGGAAAIDALRDLASEAKELGLKTLPDLNSNLAASGRFTSDELQKLFAALNTYGIKSLDQLENISNETAIAIGANLQVNNFPFEEALESIQEIRNEIDKIPQNVKRTLTFDVKVNASAQDRQVLNQAGVTQGLGIA